jgi:hypothetical protein
VGIDKESSSAAVVAVFSGMCVLRELFFKMFSFKICIMPFLEKSHW